MFLEVFHAAALSRRVSIGRGLALLKTRMPFPRGYVLLTVSTPMREPEAWKGIAP